MGGQEVRKDFFDQATPQFTKYYVWYSTCLPPRTTVEFFVYRENGRIVKSRGGILFNSEDPSLVQTAVLSAIGPGWVEDTQSENAKLFAIQREAFNPPTKRSFIASYHLDHDGITRSIGLDFNSNERLWSLGFSESTVPDPEAPRWH